ncbi:uncharacterized protein LOC115752708 [Rhodamnia argentea]|uniref:Uncharacterized protein LOC115752708 n=1 Tax=Rhodamnia argentea TaxID=178133 RepID=A0A8B8QI55_9MYRT|nr:uncharacterized protein LOC115752708 [Rhodamnia argentea]
MQPPSRPLRINLTELKAQIVKRIGVESSEQYFRYLNRLLSLKLSKAEFDKLCWKLLGKDNVRLHNQLIHAVLKNAHGKVPPPLLNNDRDLLGTNNGAIPLQNGNFIPFPTQRSPKGISEGLYGIVNFTTHLPTTENCRVSLEDQNPNCLALLKPVQHHQEAERDIGLPITNISRSGLVCARTKDQSKLTVSNFAKEVCDRHQVQAPLGISLCPARAGGAQRALALTSNIRCSSFHDEGGLLDTKTLRDRMQQVASAEGLEGVSMDCASLLNNGLDAYLKGLIRSCIEVMKTRCGGRLRKGSLHTNSFSKDKVVLPSNQFWLQNGSRPLELREEVKPPFVISMLDFKVSMELKPQHPEEDWPLLLEKICARALEGESIGV